MLHVLRILSCGYLVEISDNRVLFGGSELLVGELPSLKRLNVLSITLQGFSAVQKLMSSQKFQSCTKCLELIDCDDSKSFALADFHRVNIKACHKLRDVTWLVFAPNLTVIQIEKCMQMEVIVSARKLGEVPEMMADLNPFANIFANSLIFGQDIDRRAHCACTLVDDLGMPNPISVDDPL
ncbi:hypothetical protein CICLE_v10027363mg [Citrus x clementina]|uniref:Uncharacterized protein n=1 Tax=Citrus clementina TaxID=85681 RepID=V4UMG1_CITCL|nr:hypothetical protein CICLE_v10027363mg [Citrus x clementina]